MPCRPKKTTFRGKSDGDKTNRNKHLSTLEQIVCIKVKPDPDENENPYSMKLDKSNKPRKYGNLKFNPPFQDFLKKRPHYTTQKEAFDAAMKYVILVAKILGLFPIGERKISTVRWPIFSWRYTYCLFMNICQIVLTFLCFLTLWSTTITITKLAYFLFYLATSITSVLFLKLTTKWSNLLKELKVVDLTEYIDQNIERKCNVALITLLGFAIVEHGLGVTLKLTYTVECLSNGTDVIDKFTALRYYWIYDKQDAPISIGFGMYLVVENAIVTVISSYVHLFIICISLYLSSILEQINKVILSKEGQYLPSSQWRKLREDYNNASRLVRCFDDVINNVILIAFASNLLYVCLQLSFFLAHGFRARICYSPYHDERNPNNSPGTFYTYIYATFSVFSVSFFILRSLAVALIAARIHSESLVPAPVLYNVPSPTFSIEVQRFIQQIHGNKVALTGCNFFYVTKDIILSVVGTIVTYELVLLQFESNK